MNMPVSRTEPLGTRLVRRVERVSDVAFTGLPTLLEGPRVELDGYLHPEFSAVASAFRRQLHGYTGGGAVCVYHRGKCVVDLWGGSRDRAGNPWLSDTMSPSFSTTKGVAATLCHIMVDRRLVDYDDLVADYWPEFAQAGKGAITIRHVLSHQSGLYHIRQMIDHADRMLDWGYMVRAIERTSPVHAPGERTGYHGLTFGYLVGEILQRVTGKSFSELVQEEIVDPLELDGLYVGAPAHALHRAAELLWPRRTLGDPVLPRAIGAFQRAFGNVPGQMASSFWQRLLDLIGVDFDAGSFMDALAPRGIGTFDFGGNETLRVTIPAATGLFTARSLARMYAALAGGGAIDEVRLISPRTIARATEPQRRTGGLAVLPFDMRWRLGYQGVLTTHGIPKAAFGHFGFGGSGAWADPRRNLAVAMIVNSGMGSPFGDLRIARIGGAALMSANRRG
jgi:CubicO group peptidase (beta-lactamase class C family)